MTYHGVTPGFIETMGIDLIAGKSFADGSAKDEQEAFILNETAVRELGWTVDEAIGKSFAMFIASAQWRVGSLAQRIRYGRCPGFQPRCALQTGISPGNLSKLRHESHAGTHTKSKRYCQYSNRMEENQSRCTI